MDLLEAFVTIRISANIAGPPRDLSFTLDADDLSWSQLILTYNRKDITKAFSPTIAHFGRRVVLGFNQICLDSNTFLILGLIRIDNLVEISKFPRRYLISICSSPFMSLPIIFVVIVYKMLHTKSHIAVNTKALSILVAGMARWQPPNIFLGYKCQKKMWFYKPGCSISFYISKILSGANIRVTWTPL